jgi:putative ABC transport system ATP-binding protein
MQTMTALENVAVPPRVGRAGRRVRPGARHARPSWAWPTAHALSGAAVRRRAAAGAIARALAIDPAILIADEPTGNLDSETGREVIAVLFSTVAERGTTLVLVTHDEHLAAQCDRTVRIAAGQIQPPAAPLLRSAAAS